MRKQTLFPELALTFFYFIQQLYETLENKQVTTVYFLSREGQPLKLLFDKYNQKLGGTISTKYLEVSRRSTLLPSLGPIADENFSNLFRQYRCMSLQEFLSSLGLESYVDKIANEVGARDGLERIRENDFPNSKIFTDLISSSLFQAIYDKERILRRSSFLSYFSSLSGGFIPANLELVDVGWKGTIQDNLFNLLCGETNSGVDTITGYYIGLNASGAANSRNKKHGIVFSGVGRKSRGYNIFNENRAMFEVVLAADHGSIVSYGSTEDGCGYAIRGTFEEEDMVRSKILPAQARIFSLFDVLLSRLEMRNQKGIISLSRTIRNHSRMVFRATASEREWFSSIYHLENFGVFERSEFSSQISTRTLRDRLVFLKQLLSKRSLMHLGFWPWKTIHERLGALPASIYAIYRHCK